MAEIGLIASVLGIASAGIKLSITLYAFSETVSTAHDDIKNIARDVSLTSSVLDELAANLKNDEQAKLYSGTALATAQAVVKDCEAVFAEIEAALRKAMERMNKGEVGSGEKRKKGGKVVLSAIEKLKWPFLQPKMELLRGNLERLKSTLVLMLNVLTYARKLQTEHKKKAPKDDYQRNLIENLVRANQEATRNFQTLLRTIGSGENEKSVEVPPMQQDTKPTIQTASSSQEQSRSLDEPSMPPLSSYQAPPPAYITNMASPPSALPDTTSNPESAAAEIVLAAESTAACLKRIGKALNQFDRSGAAFMHPTRVSIELLQDLESPPGKVPPWTVLSIIEQKRAPSPIREEPYDPYQTYSDGPLSPATRLLRTLQGQIDDTVGVMRENVNKVTQRGERLDSLGSKTDNLSSASQAFRRRERLDALQDRTDGLRSSSQAFRRSAKRVGAQQSWLGTLGRAWNYVPSPSAVLSSVQAAIDASLSTSQDDDDEMVADSYPPSAPARATTDPDPSASTPKPITHFPTFDDILGTEPIRNRRQRPRSRLRDRAEMAGQIGAVFLERSKVSQAERPPMLAEPELGLESAFTIAAEAGVTLNTGEVPPPKIRIPATGFDTETETETETVTLPAPTTMAQDEQASATIEEVAAAFDVEEAEEEAEEDGGEEHSDAEPEPEEEPEGEGSEVDHLLKEWTTLYQWAGR